MVAFAASLNQNGKKINWSKIRIIRHCHLCFLEGKKNFPDIFGCFQMKVLEFFGDLFFLSRFVVSLFQQGRLKQTDRTQTEYRWIKRNPTNVKYIPSCIKLKTSIYLRQTKNRK